MLFPYPIRKTWGNFVMYEANSFANLRDTLARFFDRPVSIKRISEAKFVASVIYIAKPL